MLTNPKTTFRLLLNAFTPRTWQIICTNRAQGRYAFRTLSAHAIPFRAQSGPGAWVKITIHTNQSTLHTRYRLAKILLRISAHAILTSSP